KILANGFLCLLFRVECDGCFRAADLSRCDRGSKVHCTPSRGRDPLDSTDGAHCVGVLVHLLTPGMGFERNCLISTTNLAQGRPCRKLMLSFGTHVGFETLQGTLI